MRIKVTTIPGLSFLRYLGATAAPVITVSAIFVWLPAATAQSTEVPGYNPTVTPGIQPAASSYTPDYMRSFSADFWKGQSFMQGLQAGTVLTGVLQDKLSSKSSKVGDVFSISLLDGYSESGKELLPRGTKIVGAVTQVISGQQSRSGQPGRVEISLQTLVLPDGRSTPIYAFIERNPNTEFQQDPTKAPKGPPLGSYGQSLKNSIFGFGSSITRRAVGVPIYNPGRTGAELSMEPGEVLPLRLNRPLDLPGLLRQPIPGAEQPYSYGNAPGMVRVPGLVESEPQAAPPFRNEVAPEQETSVPEASEEPPAQKGIPDPF